jgi:hypothetical protein
VWAYTIFAPTSVDGTTVTAIDNQRVIVRLNNVTTKDDVTGTPVYATTQYLTVRRFVNKTNGNTVTIEPGHVYRITSLAFDESDLSPIPNEQTVTVYVEVSVMQWTTDDVDVAYN